jgi:hypothetical protein
MTEHAPLRDRPVFICGHPKSGTTLLRALLDSHPQLVVYPEETVFFREFLPAAQGLGQEAQLALAEERLIHIFEWRQDDPPEHQRGFPDRDYSQFDYADVRSALRRRLAETTWRHPGDLLSAAVLAFGEISGQLSGACLRWVEKSPYNERFAEQIFAWWPEAVCIHIVRDPRDNYLSYRRKHPAWSSEAFTLTWRRSAAEGLRNQARFGPGRVLLLTYERLVHHPRQVMEEVSEFLGIEPDPVLGVPSRAGVPWEGNSMFDLQFQGVSAASAGRWVEHLPGADAGVLWLLCRRLMTKFGYPPTPHIPLRAYLRAARFGLSRLLRGPARG